MKYSIPNPITWLWSPWLYWWNQTLSTHNYHCQWYCNTQLDLFIMASLRSIDPKCTYWLPFIQHNTIHCMCDNLLCICYGMLVYEEKKFSNFPMGWLFLEKKSQLIIYVKESICQLFFMIWQIKWVFFGIIIWVKTHFFSFFCSIKYYLNYVKHNYYINSTI